MFFQFYFSYVFRADNAYVHRRPRHWFYHRPISEPLRSSFFRRSGKNMEQSPARSDVIITTIILSSFKSKLKTHLFSLSFPDL